MKQKLKRFMAGICGNAHTGWNTLYEWNNSICSQSAGKYCVLECVSQNSGEVSRAEARIYHGKILYSILDGNSCILYEFRIKSRWRSAYEQL